MARPSTQGHRPRLEFSQLSGRSMPPVDMGHFRRSQRPPPVHPSQSSLIEDEYKASDSHMGLLPILQVDPKPMTQQRKRVPVACERCRKRKIKCSGDQELGRGCMNCLAAGWDRCQFLRVCDYNPLPIDWLIAKVQSFNPPVNSITSSNSNRYWGPSRYHPYSYSPQRSSHAPPMNQSPPTQQISSYPVWQTGTDFSHYTSNTTQPFTWERLPFSNTYQIAYANDSMPPFSTPPPSYMLPDPVFQQHSGSGFLQGAHRPQQGSLWIEQSSNGPPTQPLSMHMPTSYEVGNNDVRQPNGLYGPNISEFGRILPEPTGCRSLPFSAAASTETTPPLSALSHHSTTSWPADSASNASVISSHSSTHSNPTADSSYASLFSSASQDLLVNYPPRSKAVRRSSRSSRSKRSAAAGNHLVPNRPSNDPTGSLSRYSSETIDEELQTSDSPAESYSYTLRGYRPENIHNPRTFPASSVCWPDLNDKSSSGRIYEEGYGSQASHDKIDTSEQQKS